MSNIKFIFVNVLSRIKSNPRHTWHKYYSACCFFKNAKTFRAKDLGYFFINKNGKSNLTFVYGLFASVFIKQKDKFLKSEQYLNLITKIRDFVLCTNYSQ